LEKTWRVYQEILTLQETVEKNKNLGHEL
jgi:hypothetical protein